jgi:hypothetical protein
MSFFADDRADPYLESAPDAAATREERLARLKGELREHVRSLGDYKFLSVGTQTACR